MNTDDATVRPTSSLLRQKPFPRYVCHKVVEAVKIAEVHTQTPPPFHGVTCRGSFQFGSACGHCERCADEREFPTGRPSVIAPAEEGYPPFTVTAAWVRKHNPKAGGYYVLYQDGYASFSPCAAFEDGYTLLPETR